MLWCKFGEKGKEKEAAPGWKVGAVWGDGVAAGMGPAAENPMFCGAGSDLWGRAQGLWAGEHDGCAHGKRERMGQSCLSTCCFGQAK